MQRARVRTTGSPLLSLGLRPRQPSPQRRPRGPHRPRRATRAPGPAAYTALGAPLPGAIAAPGPRVPASPSHSRARPQRAVWAQSTRSARLGGCLYPAWAPQAQPFRRASYSAQPRSLYGVAHPQARHGSADSTHTWMGRARAENAAADGVRAAVPTRQRALPTLTNDDASNRALKPYEPALWLLALCILTHPLHTCRPLPSRPPQTCHPPQTCRPPQTCCPLPKRSSPPPSPPRWPPPPSLPRRPPRPPSPSVVAPMAHHL